MAGLRRKAAYARLFGHDLPQLGGEVLCIGGIADHVHIVTTLPRALSQSELIEAIKKPSSKWIKKVGPRYRGFFWQRGYGAFSISPSQLVAVICGEARRASPHSYPSGRISRIAAQTRC